MKKLSHTGNILIILFGIMLILMSILVYKSATQQVTLVSKDYYEQELKYQDKLDAMNNTKDLDHLFSISLSGDSIAIQVPVAISRNLEYGEMYFYCPSDDKADTTVYIRKSTDGLYKLPHDLLKTAGCIAKIKLTADGRAYYKEIKIP